MVFGIFFAVLIVGMLYYYVGISATIYLRERLQDAADASAFASAVVHARGMNTMALINMIMAAIMSILVTLRIIEALIIIAEVILYALAWLGGATAAIASALEVVRQLVSEISEEAEPIIQEIEVVLHYTGEIVSAITPIGANATVLGKVALKYNPEVRFGVAIPARITLPVEDDEYKYMCNKAGAMAGTLVMLPLAPLLPTKIRQKLNGAVGDLAGAGSAWFCGDENASPPTTKVEAERSSFPSSQQMKDCLNPDKQGKDSVETCRQAEEIEGRATPDEQTGRCRQGRSVCSKQKDEAAEPPVDWEFDPETYCAQRGLTIDVVTADDCATVKVGDRSFPDPSTPYGARLLGAREECRPDGKKKEYWWLEREVEIAWNAKTGKWEDTGRELTPPQPVRGEDTTRAPCDVAEVFRGTDQWVPGTTMWNSGDLTKPVCYVDPPQPYAGGGTSVRREVTQVLGCSAEVAPERIQAVRPLNLSEDKLRASPGIGNVTHDGQSSSNVGGQFKDVTMEDMQELKDFGLQNLPGAQGLSGIGGGGSGGGGAGGGDMGGFGGGGSGGGGSGSGGMGGLGGGGSGGGDMGGGNGGAGGSGSGGGSDQDDMTPFRFEKNHLLGTSDMQIRSLVVGYGLSETELNGDMEAPEQGKTAHSHAKRVVELSKWKRKDDELDGLATASEIWGMFAVAQSEYYFKVDDPDQPPFAEWKGPEVKEPDARDYLWYMGWTARMRRFRLSFEVDGKSADGESGKDGSGDGSSGGGNDSGGGGFDASSILGAAGQICEFVDSSCGTVLEQMTSFDGMFLH